MVTPSILTATEVSVDDIVTVVRFSQIIENPPEVTNRLHRIGEAQIRRIGRVRDALVDRMERCVALGLVVGPDRDDARPAPM